jgi:hypothetical protein
MTVSIRNGAPNVAPSPREGQHERPNSPALEALRARAKARPRIAVVLARLGRAHRPWPTRCTSPAELPFPHAVAGRSGELWVGKVKSRSR